MEAEVAEFLRRACYQRAGAAAQAEPGHCNGSCPTMVKPTRRPVTVHWFPTLALRSRTLWRLSTPIRAVGVVPPSQRRSCGLGCRPA